VLIPWWAFIYLVAFVAFSIVGGTLGESDGTKRVHWLAEILAEAVFAILFAGFWLPSLYRALGWLTSLLLLAALSWEIYSAPADLHELWRDPELSRKQRIGLTLLAPLLWWPLYITAAVGVWRSYALS